MAIDDVNEALKGDQRYDMLPNTDDHSDSSTEVGDWDTEDAIQPRRRRKTIWRRVKAYRWMLDTALLLVIVGLLGEKRWQHQAKSHQYELAGDITGFAPTFSQQIVSFKPNDVFAPENATEFWSKETQHAWLSIVPGRYSCSLSLRWNLGLTHYRGPGLRQSQERQRLFQPSPTCPRLPWPNRVYHIGDASTPLSLHHSRRV